MTLWPLVVVFTVIAVLLVLLSRGPQIFRGTREVAKAFTCPFRHVDVEVVERVDAWNGRHVDVVLCSAFTPPSEITCDKACLRG